MESSRAITAKHTSTPIWDGTETYKLTPTDKVQKMVLIGSALTAILSLVPSLRLTSSLILRTFSFISAGSVFANDFKTDTTWNLAIKASKIAGITLGIAAIVASAPLLLIPALSIDILFQASQLISSMGEKDPSFAKILGNLSILVVDTLFLAGIAVGSWGLMTAAASVSIIAMIAFACYAGYNARTNADIIDSVCYGILAVVGLAGAITTSQIGHRDYRYKYTIRNSHGDESLDVISGKNTNSVVASIKPTQTYSFESSHSSLSDKYGVRYNYTTYSDKYVMIQAPVEPAKFPQLPFAGGLTLGTADEMGTVEKIETPRTFSYLNSAWKTLKSLRITSLPSKQSEVDLI